MDETPLEVLKVNEQEVREEYRTEDRHRKKETEKTETQKKVLEFLDGFEGCVLQSDGYSGYDSDVDFWNENHPGHKLTHSNCNIHERRYFADAVKATGSKTAKEAVKIFGEIFTAENKLRNLFRENKISKTDFLRLRKEKVKPIFDKFHSWLLEKQQTVAFLNSSKTAEDWKKLLPWNIEITPFKMRGEWVE